VGELINASAEFKGRQYEDIIAQFQDVCADLDEGLITPDERDKRRGYIIEVASKAGFNLEEIRLAAETAKERFDCIGRAE